MNESFPYFQFFPSQHLLQDIEENELRRRGLDYFSFFFSPASGPKGIVVCGFDNQFFHSYASDKIKDHKCLVGASAGALRNVALLSRIAYFDKNIHKNTTQEWKDEFSSMHFNYGDTPASLKPKMENVYDKVAPKDIIDDVISHPTCHLAIMVMSLHIAYSHWSDLALNLLFVYFGLLRLFVDKNSRFTPHASRLCFYTGPQPELLNDDGSLTYHQLTRDNISAVLHATTCIPNIQGKHF